MCKNILVLILLFILFGCTDGICNNECRTGISSTSNGYNDNYIDSNKDRIKARLNAEIFIDDDFEEYHIDSIFAALGEWIVATDGIFYPTKVSISAVDVGKINAFVFLPADHELVEYVMTEINGHKPSSKRGPPAGFYIGYNTIYLVDTEYTNLRPKITAMHELGHYLGLGHTEEKTFMSNGIDMTTEACITQHEIDVFCSIIDCNNHNVGPTC